MSAAAVRITTLPRWALAGGIAVALACAAYLLALQALQPHPAASPRWNHGSAGTSLEAAMAVSLFSWPILMLFGAIHLLTGRLPEAVVGLELHLALYLTCLVMSMLLFRSDAPSVLLNLAALGVQGGLIAAGRRRARVSVPWLAAMIGIPILAGLLCATLAWSRQVPARLVAAAEATAAGQAHCIVRGDMQRARGPEDLGGLAIFQRVGPFRSFHALLIVGEGEARGFFLWSFTRGGFVAVEANARKRLSLHGTRPGLDSVDWCRLPPVGEPRPQRL